jgi:hypothetical protein
VRLAAAWRVGVVVLGVAGLVTVVVGAEDLAMLPVYFSEQSVVAAVVYFGLHGWFDRRSLTPAVGGAVVLYLVVTAAVFHFVLAREVNPFAELVDGTGDAAREWGRLLLHYVVPGAVVAYWALFEPKGRLRWWSAVAWLAYPAAYLVFVLVRGGVVGHRNYPYPFLDVGRLGYAGVARNSAYLAAAFLALGLTVVAVDRLAGRRAGAGYEASRTG